MSNSTIDTMLIQDAWVWRRSEQPNRFGEYTYTRDNEALKVRWEDTITEFLDTEGERVLSKAVVYLPEDVRQGDLLYLGTTPPAIPTGKTPLYYPDIRAVGRFDSTPSRRANKILRVAYLR